MQQPQLSRDRRQLTAGMSGDESTRSAETDGWQWQ